MARKGNGPTTGPLKAKLYTIPPTAPFLDVLARAVLNADLPSGVGSPPGPFDLADTVIYLPDQRACDGLKLAFLRAAPDGAVLLPRLFALGEGEEDKALSVLASAETDEDAAGTALPPAIGALERRMVLTQLIMAWSERIKRGEAGSDLAPRFAETPAAAADLALGLMRLMDEADSAGVDLRKLKELVPERFASHEELCLGFLGIVLEAWPQYLESSGRVNPMARRNRLLARETQWLKEEGGERLVIVAGCVGRCPATAGLMRAVHQLPRGAIVLPGLDLALDAESWQALARHPEHAQAGMARLLADLGAARSDVVTLPGTEPDGARRARMRFISEALRPPATVAGWPAYIASEKPEEVRAAFEGVSFVPAAAEHEEASAIALMLREAAETPGMTAVLVTPEGKLARRVRAQLGRWGLDLPDEAGAPLCATRHSVFYQLIAEAAAGGSQIALLSLLKHPLTRLCLRRSEVEAATSVLEIAAIRQASCGEGAAALIRGLGFARQSDRKHRALDALSDADWMLAEDLAERLADALRPLAALARAKSLSLSRLAVVHRAAAEKLAADETGAAPSLTGGAEAESVAAFMAALCEELPGPGLTLAGYPAFLRALLRQETYTEMRASHPRLHILGPREARLTSADRVIVGGLNEGCWPEPPEASSWLGRAAREAAGLPAPEHQLGLSAHDFCQAMGAREVIFTRALKCDGTPTIQSRWLTRIEALLKGLGMPEALTPKQPWLEWAKGETQPPARPRARPPAPCPPLALRPRRLSVSDIARLMANPYAIYARHVLGLYPLEPLAVEPGRADEGRILHRVLHSFARRHPAELPEHCGAELLAIFDERVAEYGDNARVAAFWRPRLERFARWFEATERERRGEAYSQAEVSGELTLAAPGGPFTLRCTADRIDLLPDGSVAIYDFRTGGADEKQAADFTAPQLPLQALIAMEGKFKGVGEGRRRVAKLAWLLAKGEDGGEERAIKRQSPEALAEVAREGLTALLTYFDNEAAPYTAMRRGSFKSSYRFDDYAHLARVEEWSGVSEEG